MAESIKIPFGLWACVGPRNHTYQMGSRSPVQRGNFEQQRGGPLLSMGKKGKEEYLYSAFLNQGTHKALRHGSHSFTCEQHHACLSFVSVHQMSPPQQLRQQTSNCSSLLIYRPRKDEGLSWRSLLTYSGWLTHISGHPSATSRAQNSESTSAKDQCSTAGPRYQPPTASCVKTAEPTKIPFWMWTRVGSRKHVLDGVHIGTTWRIRPRGEAMQPYVKSLRPLVIIYFNFHPPRTFLYHRSSSRSCDMQSVCSSLSAADGSETAARLTNSTSATTKEPPHHTTTVLWPFFRDHPGEPVPEENFWILDFMVQGKINKDRDHPAGRHSIRTNQCPPPPSPFFYRPDALPAIQPTLS